MAERLDIAYVGERFPERLSGLLAPEETSLSVFAAARADDVLERVAADGDTFDCVVCEHHLAELDAVDFLDAVSAAGEVPVVLLTTDGTDSLATAAVAAEITEYVSVGEDGDSWADGVARIVERARERRASRGGGEPATPYKHLVEQNIAGVYEIRGETFSYVNPTFAEIFGYGREELVGASPFDLIVERQHDELRADMAALAEGEVDQVETEFRGRRRDGEAVVVEAHGQLIEREPEPVYLGFVTDVTESKRRERRLEAVFDNTYQFTGLLEPDGTVIEVNETALALADLDRGAVVGELAWDVPWFADDEARRTVRAAVEGARAGEQVRDEVRLQGTDRELVVDVTVRPVTDERGEVTLLVAEGHDVTGRVERERERRTIISRVTDAIVEIDGDWRFTMVDERAEEIYGVDESALLGRQFWDVFEAGLGTRFEEVYRRVMRRRSPEAFEAYYGGDLDEWFHVNVYPSADGGLAFYFQVITERRQREERTAGLNELLTGCMAAETGAAVAEIAVEAAEGRLNLPVATVALVDEGRGELAPAAVSAAAREHLDVDALLDREGGAAWEAFVTGEATTVDEPVPDLLDEAASVEELFVHPLGRHGVLVVGSPLPDAEFVRTVAEDVRRTFDRIERERLLQEREAVLRDRNESLDRLNRLNEVIRNIDQALVGATTRREVGRAVCEQLVGTASYAFAWMGEYDPTTERVSPREWAGDEQGYLEAAGFPADVGGDDLGPTGRAVRFREPQVVEDVLTDPPREPWREAALRRDFRSSIALPLTYRDSLYGVLHVYADRPGLFDTLERRVLAELGETIGHAINALESKKALVSDAVTEVELRVDVGDHPLTRFLAGDPDRAYEFEGVVPAEDGTFRVFFTVRGAAPEAVAEFVRQSVAIEDGELISADDEACLFEATMTEDSLVFWLLDRGAVPQSISLTGEGGRLRVELAGDTDVRGFVGLFQAAHPDAELVASRERERPVRTRRDFHASVERRLTDRQREMLQTAYYSGYFETPRERSGAEIADSVGISPSTFSDHIRAGLGNLLGLLYEDDDAGE